MDEKCLIFTCSNVEVSSSETELWGREVPYPMLYWRREIKRIVDGYGINRKYIRDMLKSKPKVKLSSSVFSFAVLFLPEQQ